MCFVLKCGAAKKREETVCSDESGVKTRQRYEIVDVAAEKGLMSQHFLYSTHTFLKQHICLRYRSDLHYVWCSEDFDSAKVAAYAPGSLLPPSSNPASIYRNLVADVVRGDMHSDKIRSQQASLIKLAIQWEAKGEISRQDKVDIAYMVKNAPISNWRPLIFVIHRAAVQSRLQLVPMNKRAGLADEFIIPDLHRSEFDMIEI